MRSRHGPATNDPPQMVLRLCSTAVHSVTIGGHRTSSYCGLPTKQRKDVGRPRVRRGRALSRGQATARPSPQAVSAHSGYDRSAKNAAHATPASKTQTLGLEPLFRLHAAQWQPHQLISGRAPMARTKILHTRGSSAPRWMGLVSRTADKAKPGILSHTSVPALARKRGPNSFNWLRSDDRAGRHLPGLDIPPESDHQLACKRDDHDASDPPP
jgi:hypothetical protein